MQWTGRGGAYVAPKPAGLMLMRSGLGVAAGLLAVSACASGPAYPDEAGAREYLSMLTSMAEAGNPDDVCASHSLSQGACLDSMDVVGFEAPTASPRVVCSWVYEDKYRVLVLKGRRASGQRYTNHLAVSFNSSGEMQATESVYWLNKPPPGTDESKDWKPEAVCR